MMAKRVLRHHPDSEYVTGDDAEAELEARDAVTAFVRDEKLRGGIK